jgi:hypothetical protein
VAWVGAIRLARPNSRWAHRRYANKPRKLEKATVRGARWDRWRTRLEDLIGGMPTPELMARERKPTDTAPPAGQPERPDTAPRVAERERADTAAKEAGSGDA